MSPKKKEKLIVRESLNLPQIHQYRSAFNYGEISQISEPKQDSGKMDDSVTDEGNQSKIYMT